MKQKCVICKKTFANLRMHLQRSSKCAHWAQMKNAPTDSQNIVNAAAETNDSNNSDSDSNDNEELVDNLSISNTEHINMFLIVMILMVMLILDLLCQVMIPKESQ